MIIFLPVADNKSPPNQDPVSNTLRLIIKLYKMKHFLIFGSHKLSAAMLMLVYINLNKIWTEEITKTETKFKFKDILDRSN